MWNNHSWLLCIRVKLTGIKPRVRLFFPVALWVLYQLLLSCDGLLALLPGKHGRKARSAVDTANTLFLGMTHAEPQEYVRVNVQDGDKKVRLNIRTLGWKGEENE